MHAAGESAFDGGGAERGGENLTRGFAHAGELVVSFGSQVGHGRDYRDSCSLPKVIS
jgi:hypothetical protein